MKLNYCFKGLAFQETVPAPTPFTGVDAEVQGAVASNIICGCSIKAIMSDFQSEDGVSITLIRSMPTASVDS